MARDKVTTGDKSPTSKAAPVPTKPVDLGGPKKGPSRKPVARKRGAKRRRARRPVVGLRKVVRRIGRAVARRAARPVARRRRR